jgi:hypothetical protein
MRAEILPADQKTSFVVSRLFYEKHIYNATEDELRDVWGVHRLLSEIESGDRIVVGFFSDNVFLGCSHGVIVDGVFEGHFLFFRKAPTVDLVKKGIHEIVQYGKQKGTPVNSLRGIVPDSNRAVKLLLSRLGFLDTGPTNTFFVLNGKNIMCREFTKRII